MKIVKVKLIVEIDGEIFEEIKTLDYSESVAEMIADGILSDDNDSIAEHIGEEVEMNVMGD